MEGIRQGVCKGCSSVAVIVGVVVDEGVVAEVLAARAALRPVTQEAWLRIIVVL